MKSEGASAAAQVCLKCGFQSETGGTIVAPEKTTSHPQIRVIGDKEKSLRTMPTERVDCPKCGNREAYWWLLQTRSGDEPATQFYRCTKCEHTWRSYA